MAMRRMTGFAMIADSRNALDTQRVSIKLLRVDASHILNHPTCHTFTVDSDWDMELADGTPVEAGQEVEVNALVDGNELLQAPETCVVAELDGEALAVNFRLVGAIESVLERWGHLQGQRDA